LIRGLPVECHKLADRLNLAELPSRLGTKWHPRTVLNILRNPIYMGVTYFNRRQRVHIPGKRHSYVARPQSDWAVIDGATPAIAYADLFRTVQARLDQPLVRPVPHALPAVRVHPLCLRWPGIGA
jgi:hypothetical protein